VAELRCAEKAPQDLERESRLAEMLIGELLGPAENHGPATVTTCNGLGRVDAHRFRTLAENRQQVEALLDRGVVKRKALLDAPGLSLLALAAIPQPSQCEQLHESFEHAFSFRVYLIAGQDLPDMPARSSSTIVLVQRPTDGVQRRGPEPDIQRPSFRVTAFCLIDALCPDPQGHAPKQRGQRSALHHPAANADPPQHPDRTQRFASLLPACPHRNLNSRHESIMPSSKVDHSASTRPPVAVCRASA
jgi:hypothetical protein